MRDGKIDRPGGGLCWRAGFGPPQPSWRTGPTGPSSWSGVPRRASRAFGFSSHALQLDCRPRRRLQGRQHLSESRRRRSAHRTAGLDSRTTSEAEKLTMSAVRRTLGVRQRQARPLSVSDLKRIVTALDDDLAGLRDRSLLLLGFSVLPPL